VWSSGSWSSSLLTSSPKVSSISRTIKICRKRTRFTDESTNLISSKQSSREPDDRFCSTGESSSTKQASETHHAYEIRGRRLLFVCRLELSLHWLIPVPCVISSHRHTVAALDWAVHASWHLLRNVNIVSWCTFATLLNYLCKRTSRAIFGSWRFISFARLAVLVPVAASTAKNFIAFKLSLLYRRMGSIFSRAKSVSDQDENELENIENVSEELRTLAEIECQRILNAEDGKVYSPFFSVQQVLLKKKEHELCIFSSNGISCRR